MNLTELQNTHWIKVLRRFLAVLGMALIVYLVYHNWPVLVEAFTSSPRLLFIGLLIASASLCVQALGFRSFPKISAVPVREVLNIWCSAVIFNHIFPLAGGLGYRFVAFRSNGIDVKDTGKATLWFLGVSATVSTTALGILYALTHFNFLLTAFIIGCLVTGAITWIRWRAIRCPPFVLPMIAYQIMQVVVMGMVVVYGAQLVGLDLSFIQAAVLGCVMRLGTLISLTPAGLGIQEAIIVGVLGSYGVTSTSSSATAIMVRVLYLFAAIVVAGMARLLQLRAGELRVSKT